MKTVLVIGATRNLGKALVTHYSSEPNTTVYATARYGKPLHHPLNVHWISGVDISHEDAGKQLTLHYNHEFPIDIVYVVATSSSSLFAPETLESLKFDKALNMYKTTAIGPLFLIQNLLKAGILAQKAKIIFIGSEAGSISLRTKGGDYGFHGSQAALNMVARLLSYDLAPKNIAVGVVYPGRITLEDDSRHAHGKDETHPEVAVTALTQFVENTFGMARTGEVWASRGFESLPTLADTILDPKDDETPIQLPW